MIPGTLVAIAPNSPRISSGACGLGSKLSMWLIPPCSQTRMHDTSRPVSAARGPRLELQEARQAQTQGSQRADTQHVTPRHAVASPIRTQLQVEHRTTSLSTGHGNGDSDSRSPGRIEGPPSRGIARKFNIRLTRRTRRYNEFIISWEV